jgi:hypothetical protein
MQLKHEAEQFGLNLFELTLRAIEPILLVASQVRSVVIGISSLLLIPL